MNDAKEGKQATEKTPHNRSPNPFSSTSPYLKHGQWTSSISPSLFFPSFSFLSRFPDSLCDSLQVSILTTPQGVGHRGHRGHRLTKVQLVPALSPAG